MYLTKDSYREAKKTPYSSIIKDKAPTKMTEDLKRHFTIEDMGMDNNYVHEKMFNISSYQGGTSENHNHRSMCFLRMATFLLFFLFFRTLHLLITEEIIGHQNL